jgi:hypothetical protein
MKGSFTARTTLSLAAWEAGGELEAEMVVKFTVCPGCAQTQFEPGQPPFVEDISVRLFTTKTKTELFCPTWVTDQFSENEAFCRWLLSEAADQDECAREDAAETRREMLREERSAMKPLTAILIVDLIVVIVIAITAAIIVNGSAIFAAISALVQ